MNRRALLVSVLILAGLLVYAWVAVRDDERERVERWQEGERIFTAARETVDSLEISGRGREIRFEHGAGGWEAPPGEEAVRAEQVPEVLYSWSLARFLVYVDEEPENLSGYGLDPPRYRLVATTEGGARHTLSLGADSSLATALGTYVLVDDRPEVVLLEAGIWNLISEIDLALGFEPETPEP